MQYTAMRLSPEDRAYLDDRYGRTHRSRWPVYVVSVIVAALAAWAVWAFNAQIHPKVTSGLSTYTIVNAQKATATFDVVRADASVRATCTVQALAQDHSTVGQLAKIIPVASPTKSTFTVTIKTTRKAFAVNWLGCTAPGQNSPK
ncbi:MAG: DUF4307 domain-containing protein [Marmoricola sp.]